VLFLIPIPSFLHYCFGGSLSWLIDHWQSSTVTPLVSQATTQELLRVLNYPKFSLSTEKIQAFTAYYLPFTEKIENVISVPNAPVCRDPHDQKFINLAILGQADILVTGDTDLHVLNEQLPFALETPTTYQLRVFSK
jgi:putative PIN family toxin of toxin-antitoxin system